jgi:hypothetical protein
MRQNGNELIFIAPVLLPLRRICSHYFCHIGDMSTFFAKSDG